MMMQAAPALLGIGSTAAVGGALSVGQGAAATAASATQPLSFGDMLEQVATGAVDTLEKGEATAISGIQGKASVQSVVEAVMNADQALQTAIAIRDKAVSAYQEISRMAI
jgi:flagellar hook-basal body complex protein FliE